MDGGSDAPKRDRENDMSAGAGAGAGVGTGIRRCVCGPAARAMRTWIQEDPITRYSSR